MDLSPTEKRSSSPGNRAFLNAHEFGHQVSAAQASEATDAILISKIAEIKTYCEKIDGAETSQLR